MNILTHILRRLERQVSLPKNSLFRGAGTVELSRDEEATITPSNTGADGFVILDAMQLVEVTE